MGPVFNVGERVEGVTSPLWTLLLAGAALAHADLEAAARVGGLVCGVGAIMLVFIALHRQLGFGRRWVCWVVTLALATSPALVFWSASGMDAPLFMLLATASLLSALADRRDGPLSWRTATLLLLTTATRLEGVLVAGYVGAIFAYERRSVRPLVGYLIAIGGMLLARHAYYGEWLPNTFHAKVTSDSLSRLGRGVAYVVSAAGAYGPLLLAAALALLIVRRRKTGPDFAVRFLAGWMALWAAYLIYVGGDHFALHRFCLPILPAGMLILGLTYGAVARGPRATPVPLAAGALLLAVIASNVLAYRLEGHDARGEVALARGWANTGRWIARATPPDTVVATPVIGAIGYFSDRSIVDMLGLTDRTIARHGRTYAAAAPGHARYHTDYIFERQPHLVIYLSSGRWRAPHHARAELIPRTYAYALYDFVTDPRCPAHYQYATARLDDATLVEMQKRIDAIVYTPTGTGATVPERATRHTPPKPNRPGAELQADSAPPARPH